MTARAARATSTRPNRLPGSEELFRRTSPADAAAVEGTTRVDAKLVGGPDGTTVAAPAPAAASTGIHAVETPTTEPTADNPERRPTGRERHDEKITVYVSNEELIELEDARVTLKRLGVKADRGRIVREALAELIGDLERHGDQAVLVRRLRAE